MKFVSPKNDVAFKKIFGSEDKKEILISFLNAVLNLAGDKEIQDIEILNKHADNLEVVPASDDTPALRSAYETANQFNWSRDEMELYDYWGIKAQDERGKLQAAYEKGEQKGLTEGKTKGRQEGKLEGKLESRLETARKMLSKGYDISEISDLTGLSADIISGLSEA